RPMQSETGPCASECLAQADVDFEAVILGLPTRRQGDIEAYRTDRAVVAHARAHADSICAGQQPGTLADAAPVGEDHDTKFRTDSLSQLQVEDPQRRASLRHAIRLPVGRELWADGLIAKAAHGATSAGVEALVGRQVVPAGARSHADHDACRNDGAAGRNSPEELVH